MGLWRILAVQAGLRDILAQVKPFSNFIFFTRDIRMPVFMKRKYMKCLDIRDNFVRGNLF
jgi:hypothetical protein